MVRRSLLEPRLDLTWIDTSFEFDLMVEDKIQVLIQNTEHRPTVLVL